MLLLVQYVCMYEELLLEALNPMLAGSLTKMASVLHRRTFKVLLDDDNSFLYIYCQAPGPGPGPGLVLPWSGSFSG